MSKHRVAVLKVVAQQLSVTARQLRAQRDDPHPDLVRRPAGIGARPARPRLDGLEAALPVPVQEPVQVPAADPVLGCRGVRSSRFGAYRMTSLSYTFVVARES
jgi:hypothetical protein